MQASRQHQWAAILAEHVAAVETGQERLTGVLTEKRQALIDGTPERIDALCREEQRLVTVFSELARARGALLRDAHADNLQPRSLSELAEQAGVPAELRDRILAARAGAERLRQLNLTQRLVASRTAKHYSDLMDLIAGAGRKPEAYGQREATGGGLLDASA